MGAIPIKPDKNRFNPHPIRRQGATAHFRRFPSICCRFWLRQEPVATSLPLFCSGYDPHLARTSCLRQPVLVVRAPLFDSDVAIGWHRHTAREFPGDLANPAR